MTNRQMFRRLSEAHAEAPPADLDTLSNDAEEFNRQIGLPVHPKTGRPSPLRQYQLDLIKYPGPDLVVVKSNKIGITEAILRDMAMKGVVGDCVGFQLMLAAQDLRLAVENMRRLQDIFLQSSLLTPLVKAKSREVLELRNGTKYFVMPRRAEALRGWPRVKYAFLDEAAHSGLLDDEKILAATSSRMANTGGYLRVVSTPKGQRGYFYRLVRQAMAGENRLKVMTLTYHVAPEDLIDPEFIEREKLRLGPLFAQEYECAFLTSGIAAFPAELVDSIREDY
jgi:hypothetical protein